MPRKHRLILGGRSWYVTPRPRAEGERPLVGAMPLRSAPNDHNQPGTARARSKLAYGAASRETVSRVARSCVPREHWLIMGGRSWYVAPRPHAEGKSPFVGVASLPCARGNHNQRSTARALQARVLRLLPRNSKRSSAHTRATPKRADSGRPQLVRGTTAVRRRREASCHCSVLA